MQDYRKLLVWQKAHKLALDVYADCATYLNVPESRALRDQLHRAAISVPSNLAEGAGRSTRRDFRRFAVTSLGSVNELEYHLLLAKDLRLVPDRVHAARQAQVAEVRRMLSSFVRTLAAGAG